MLCFGKKKFTIDMKGSQNTFGRWSQTSTMQWMFVCTLYVTESWHEKKNSNLVES